MLAAGVAPARAGQGVFITVHNKTSASVSLVGAEGSNCWEGQQLIHGPDERVVPPGGVLTYASEKKTGGSCKNSDGHQRIQFMVKDGPRWYLPEGSPPAYRLFWQDGGGENFGVNFYDGLTTWLPREDGYGLICMHAEVKDANHGDVWVWGDSHCNEAVPATIQHSSPKPRQRSRAALLRSVAGEEDSKDKLAVANVLSSVGIACAWWVHAKDPQYCEGLDVGNEANWALDNLTAEVANFKIIQAAAGKSEKVAVAAAQNSVPKGKAAGKVGVNQSIGLSESTTTTTQHGFKIGLKFGRKTSVKTKIPMIGEGGTEFSQELGLEYNYTTTKSEQTTKSESRTVTIESPAEPGFTTRLEVYTVKGNANYLFEADLGFGDKKGEPQNVTTPAPLALDQSPVRRQPCLGYAVGEKGVRNSLVDVGRQMLDAGYKPNDSSKPLEFQSFLLSIPFFHNGPVACKGFPAGYSSSASFKGTGVGTYANLGYDARGNPVSVMVGCTYVRPFPESSSPGRSRAARVAARATVSEPPCRETPVKGGKLVIPNPGMLIDDGKLGGPRAGRGLQGPIATGTPGSDLVVGPARGGTVRTGGGAFDVVHAGNGDTRVIAGARENIIYGGKGDDLLEGGHGMNYIYGGSGADRMVVSKGAAVMHGGSGDDLFQGEDMKGAMFGGGGDNKMVGSGSLSRLQMSAGGRGDNLYVLEGTGTPSIVQLPGPGTATVLTTGSFRVPANIDVARAIGPRRVRLVGGEAAKLVAGPRGGVLVSGPGPTLLRGRSGPDRIVFDGLNDDTATGGAGADRYLFTGTPVRTQRPAGLRYPARRFAPKVTDFDPAGGDRLVMSPRVFGREVLRLRDHFVAVAGAKPRPRRPVPTLLLDTRNGVVSFDRDGTGPISDKVVVTLPRAKSLRRGWFVFSAG
jgi:hypothetical protein